MAIRGSFEGLRRSFGRRLKAPEVLVMPAGDFAYLVNFLYSFLGSQSHEEGQEDQGEVKELGGAGLAVFRFLVLPAFHLALPALLIRPLRALRGPQGPYKALMGLIRPLRAL